MLTVKQGGMTATIDKDFTTGGDEPLASMMELKIASIDPEGSHAGNTLAFLFYELRKKGYDVQADDGDIDPADNIPDDAVA